MKFWIKKCAFLAGVTVFFLILFSNLLGVVDILNTEILFSAIIQALFGGAMFWFTGFIIGDIVFKGVLTDIDTNDKSNLLEGGLVQRFYSEKERHIPGGAELPFVTEKAIFKKDKRKVHK